MERLETLGYGGVSRWYKKVGNNSPCCLPSLIIHFITPMIYVGEHITERFIHNFHESWRVSLDTSGMASVRDYIGIAI